MAVAIAKPLSTVAAAGENVLELAAEAGRSVEGTDRNAGRVRQRRWDLAEIVARRIAWTARREELAVKRESLWSGLLDLDEWRRDLVTRCRAATRRHQELLEALAADRASVAQTPRGAAPAPEGPTEDERAPRPAHVLAGQRR